MDKTIDKMRKALDKKVEQQFSSYNSAKLRREQIDKALSFAAKVVDKMNTSESKTRVLLFGEVQSGKTTSYSAIIAKLFDSGSNYVVLTPAVDNVLLKQTFDRMKEQFGSLINVLKPDDVIVSPEKVTNMFNSKRKILLVVLKHKKSLANAIKITKRWSKQILSPVFIDDEGDQASYNSKKNNEMSVIHDLINQSLHSHEKMKMITVTATPMAHVLVSSDYSIKPDFAFYIEPGEGYFGLEEFVENKDKYVRIVSDAEAEVLSDLLTNPLPDSVKEAIFRFAIFNMLTFNNEFEVSSMMVNFDQKIKMHQHLSRAIDHFVNSDVQDYAASKPGFSEKIISQTGEKSDLAHDEVVRFIGEFAKSRIRVKTVNSDETNFDDLRNPQVSMIYVGASMMQRGLTFKNLCVSFFTNRAQGKANADTTLQRARWFGYWKNKNLIKVYMQESVFEDFVAINEAIKDLIHRVNVYEKNNWKFNDFDRKILLPKSDLLPVRKSVAPSYRLFLSSINYRNDIYNSKIAERFYSKIYDATDTGEVFPGLPFKGYVFKNTFEVYDWMPKDEITQLLEDILSGPREAKTIIDYAEKSKCGIIFANMYVDKEKRFRERTVYSDRTFILAQGRNEGNGYLGDRYWWKSASPDYSRKIIIQLNCIQFKNKAIAPIFKGALVMSPDTAAEMAAEYVTSDAENVINDSA